MTVKYVFTLIGRHHQNIGTRRLSRLNAGYNVLKHKALVRMEAEPIRTREIALWVRLSSCHIVAGHHEAGAREPGCI